jgi:hypothetical protein
MMTTKDYLKSLYGDVLPTRDEEAMWKLSEIEMYHRSPLFAIQNYYKIPNKDKVMISLRPFAGQAILDVCIEAQRRAGIKQRVVGYKPRQVGWSTWMLGRTCHHCTSGPNRRAMFLVPDEDVASEMALRYGSMNNNLPRFLQPMKRIQNMKHVHYDNPNSKDRFDDPGLNSSVQITVPSAMRGIPPEMVTISEYSHMKEDEQRNVTVSVLPAMANSANTCAVIDTTPNGYDKFYHPLVMEAYEANEEWIQKLELSPRSYTAEEILAGAIGQPDNLYDSAWLLAYERWDWHEEYAVRSPLFPRGETKKPPPPIWKAFLADIGKNSRFGGDEEVFLRDRFGVQPEQLYWRRDKIKSYKMPSYDISLGVFHQEFSMSIESGFIELDKTPFGQEEITKLLAMRRDPIAGPGLLEERMVNGNKVIGVSRESNTDRHRWRVYAPPEQGELYCIGVDTNQAYEDLDSDASAAVVMRYRDRKVCAVYTAHAPGHILREQIFLAYKWYMRAFLAVETEGLGYQLIRDLIEMGANNYYRWKAAHKPQEDSPTDYPGWQTDSKTRPMMDAKFIEALCWRDPQTNKLEPKINIPDYEAINQITGIRRESDGGLKSKHGEDDIFDCICICLYCFDDPWSGFHKSKPEPTKQEQAREFERFFKNIIGGNRDRNHPSLANL